MPVFAVDKPLGVTSHDVVARARRLLRTRRVGHAGTLDPLAGGVLVLLADDATKLSPFLTDADKHYLAWVAFGASTPTLDAEGPIDTRGDPTGIAGDAVRAALPPFLLLERQTPPAFSAVKRAGVKGYEAARAGEELALPPRPVAYKALELLAWGERREALPQRFAPGPDGWGPAPDGRALPLPPTLAPLPTALLRVSVGAGTYVRALARDLGAALGAPAHLAGLVRTRAGGADLARAVALEALPDAVGLSPAEALPYPTHALSAAEAARVRQGQRLPLAALTAAPERGRVGLLDPQGALVAVAELQPQGMKLLRVWSA